jgi:hypothetical protein
LDQEKILTLRYKGQEFHPADPFGVYVFELMDGFELEIDFAHFSFRWVDCAFTFLQLARETLPGKVFKLHLKLVNAHKEQGMTRERIGLL